jgi:hypothetical protein
MGMTILRATGVAPTESVSSTVMNGIVNGIATGIGTGITIVTMIDISLSRRL